MSKSSFAVVLAFLITPAIAQADGRGRTDDARVSAAPAGATRVAQADDDEDEDAPPAKGAKAKGTKTTKGAKAKGSKPAKDEDADAAADDEDADDEDADAEDADADRKKGWRRKPTKAAADDDEDADAADADEEAEPVRKSKKKKPKVVEDEDEADDDADTAADDDEDEDEPVRKKKPRKVRKRKQPAVVEEPVDTGPQIVQERYIFPPKMTVAAELLGAKPMDSVNGDLFAAGGGVGVGVEYFISPALAIHVGASFLYFRAGPAMETTSWAAGQLGPRLHVGPKLFGAATHNAAWIDAHVTYGSSGGIRRPGFDLGGAVQWELSPGVRVGPMIRYAFGSDPLDKNAHLVTGGLAFGFGGRTRATVHIEGDADGDGLIDRTDECPTELPGDQPDDAHPGCPQRDGDDDGVIDDEDECPDEAAGGAPDEDHPGCPFKITDGDGDTVPDNEDKCPTEPGADRPGSPTQGCPLARVTDQHIEIFEQIFFENNSATISESSSPVLEAIAKVLGDLGEAHVSIEGHTDDVGSDTFNMDLSKRRARSVAQWLIDHGVAATRLETKGFGKRRPLVSGKTADTTKNRRVEFVILEDK